MNRTPRTRLVGCKSRPAVDMSEDGAFLFSLRVAGGWRWRRGESNSGTARNLRTAAAAACGFGVKRLCLLPHRGCYVAGALRDWDRF